jgi:hypothetical protein
MRQRGKQRGRNRGKDIRRDRERERHSVRSRKGGERERKSSSLLEEISAIS